MRCGHMAKYDTRIHIGCGGSLTFEKEQRVNFILNKKAVERFGAKAIIKPITKNLYRCDKCNDLVNVITCPSYEEFVLRGKIRVSKEEYWKIKKARKDGALRL